MERFGATGEGTFAASGAGTWQYYNRKLAVLGRAGQHRASYRNWAPRIFLPASGETRPVQIKWAKHSVCSFVGLAQAAACGHLTIGNPVCGGLTGEFRVSEARRCRRGRPDLRRDGAKGTGRHWSG